MAKLYPPYIEGTLPAFCLKEGDGTITIPFAHNKAVSKADIGNMYIKVKTVQNDVLISSGPVDGYDKENCTMTINVSGGSALNGKWPVTVGQYYKIQTAYADTKGEVGYYSTVGVIKCTSEPEVTIVDLSDTTVNNNRIEFIGQFKQAEGGDVTEKVYSSVFTITDLQGNEIATTGEILHNVENNPNSYTSIDAMIFNKDLEFGEIYKIKYTVTTNNGLVWSSPEYLLTQQKSLNMELAGKLKAALNSEEGYIDISIIGALIGTTIEYKNPDGEIKTETVNLTPEDLDAYLNKLKAKYNTILSVEKGPEEIGNGAFVLTREDSLNPGYWNELGRFALKYESPSKTIFRDFTIEQGKTYTYSIQQYNKSKVYSDRKKSNKIYADFDDMFLFDGKRQLKLQFNPQVSSFKTQLAETRSETIGSKYPFFFRNARVGYKVFPISGLVSMLTDDNQFFISYKDILRDDFVYDRHNEELNKKQVPEVYPHHWEIDHNFVSERLFKMEVLDWFNDGKVKLFKSPGEGNYLVRLMDTSLTPQAPLGRMLHTISSTAYECADCIYSNMVQYGIIEDSASTTTVEDTYVINWNEVSIAKLVEDKQNSSIVSGGPMVAKATIVNKFFSDTTNESDNLLVSDLGNTTYTTNLRLLEFMPGTQFRLQFADKNQIITIGATGNYYADDIEPIYGIYMLRGSNNTSDYPVSLSGSVMYQYEVPARNKFDSIASIETDIGCYKQFVGKVDDIIKDLECTREQVTKVSMSRYFKRPVEYLFYKGTDLNTLYWDTEYKNTYDYQEHMEYSPFSIYVLRDSNVTVNGQKQSILTHIKRALPEGEERIHRADHMFEKYYIDRYINAKTPEDMLTERMALIARIAACEDPEEKQALQEAMRQNPVYVVDPLNGGRFTVGVNYNYDPTIVYNNEPIDLREIQRYDLDNLEPTETKIAIGNGVYGDIFYQRVVMNYSFEDVVDELKAAKNTYNTYLTTLQNMRKQGNDPSKTQLAQLDAYYKTYNDILAETITNWVTRESDLRDE